MTEIENPNKIDQIADMISGNLDASNSAWANLVLWVDQTDTTQVLTRSATRSSIRMKKYG